MLRSAAAHGLRVTAQRLRAPRRRSCRARASSALALPPQNGRVVLITGATDGIGRHTAARLAGAGAEVLVHGRSEQRVTDTVAQLQRSGGAARGFVADLSSLDDTRRLAQEVAAAAPQLHGVVNNAGVFAPAGERRVLTRDGLETTFAVNVAAPFLLGAALLPLLRAAGGAVLVNTASISHAGVGRTLPLDDLQGEARFSSHRAYSLSKLCVVMFTLAQARRLAAAGDARVRAVTLDPGTVNTKMLLAGWGPCGMQVEQADDTAWAATSPAAAGGAYYVGRREATPDAPAHDQAAQEALWQRLVAITRADFV
jgi:NAD(P)-dependent dehydrogenase (short-subunit alcohol dehydrogenase family)